LVSIGSGDWDAGLAGFEKALEHMDPSNPEYMRASIGRCRALARLDPARGKAEFLKLADAQKSRIDSAGLPPGRQRVRRTPRIHAGDRLDGVGEGDVPRLAQFKESWPRASSRRPRRPATRAPWTDSSRSAISESSRSGRQERAGASGSR
jgi:hypothetical protein